MKTIQVLSQNNEIIVSITEYEDGIKGICDNDYKVVVDGKELNKDE